MKRGLIAPDGDRLVHMLPIFNGPIKRRFDPPQTRQTKSRIKDAAFNNGSVCESLGYRSGNDQLFATATERPAMETHWPELDGDCILI